MDNDLPTMELTVSLSKYIAVVKIGRGAKTATLISAYFKYSHPTENFTERLRAILDDNPRSVICADTNAHSPMWFSTDKNKRGEIVEDLIKDYNLNIEAIYAHMTDQAWGHLTST